MKNDEKNTENLYRLKEVIMRQLLASVLMIVLMLAVMPSQAKAESNMSDFLKKVDLGFAVDTTYQYVFDKDDRGDIVERGLYPEHNDFSIDAFTISIEKVPTMEGDTIDLVGFRADILFGEQAERLGFGFNSDGDGAVSPYQAYVNLLIPTGESGFNFYAGQFTTLAGWELIEAKDNTNITRSLLFYRIPFAHTGIRTTFSTGPLDLALGLSNDWDAIDDENDAKTFESQIALNLPYDGWVGVTGYFGNTGEEPDDELRSLITVVGSVTLMEKLTLVGDFEYTWDDLNGDRWGVAGYATLAMSDLVSLSLRGEYVDDSDRVDDIGTDRIESVELYEFTSTLILKPFSHETAGNLEARLEYRYDKADGDDSDSYFGEDDNQSSVAVQLLYWM